MEFFVWIVGILIMFGGLLLLIKPDIFRKTLFFLQKGKLIYIPAGLRIVIGIIFLIYARSGAIPWVIITFGIIILAAGISMFAIKIDTLKKFLDWWQQRSPTTMRIIAAVALLIGAVILYAGTPK